MPVGAYTATASAFGYNGGTANNVVVTDGGFVTQNFALVALPKVTISGVVSDGSGQGWPLYAAITVDGVPGGPVYTSPVNGSYSMRLPTNAIYTLHVTPAYAGYRAGSASVPVGSSNVTQNFPLTVAPVACDAAGYTEHTTGTVQRAGVRPEFGLLVNRRALPAGRLLAVLWRHFRQSCTARAASPTAALSRTRTSTTRRPRARSLAQ